jgi:Pup amidohydrolase
MRRQTPFADIVTHLTPFFVTRQVVTGAGGSASARTVREHGFQISQRADFFEVEVGLETTLKRPIINTRDEPHADAEQVPRLHVIIGDANLSEISTYLKVGTTELVLAMIEDKVHHEPTWPIDDPVRALHEVSHDPSLTTPLRLSDGRTITALQMQWSTTGEQASAFVEDRYGSTSTRDGRRAATAGSGADAAGVGTR